MINNQIHRNKILDNLKGIDSEKASIRATEIKEIEEFFLLQHILAFLGAFIITYFLVIGILENAEKLKGFSGLFFGLLFTSITIFFARFTILEFFYTTKKLILFLDKYVSLFKVITHTVAISASATALSFLLDSEQAMIQVKSLKAQGIIIIDQYYLYPVLVYISLFGAIALYHFHNSLFRETKTKETK